MKKMKKILFVFVLLTLCFSISLPTSAAAKISAKSVTLSVGQSKMLKVFGAKKVKWSSNKKSVASVTAKGKVTAKKKGTATITAKAGKKKFTCKIKVEAPKISNKSLTLIKGKTAMLSISGTKRQISWSSSNNSVATVSSNGTVSGIADGTCTITANVGGKKLYCKVTVKSESKSSNTTTSSSATGVTYSSHSTTMGIVVILTNNYAYPVDIDVDCLYYDGAGRFLDKTSNSNYATPQHSKCALLLHKIYNSAYWDMCESYDLKFKIKKSENVKTGHRFDTNTSMGINSAIVEITNTGYSNEYTKVAVVFYKGGKVIGCDEHYADVEYVGASDILDFSYPYDSDYDTIYPDKCEVYINSSYSYVW